MPKEPSIKGSALQSVVEDVVARRDKGHLTEEMLVTRLERSDLELLETKIQPALWYPIDSYRRLSELLMDSEGYGNPDYLARRGAKAAERLWESGLYVQLEHGEEKAERARQEGGALSERDARLLTTLSGALFNFTTWTYRSDGDQARIEVSDALEFPEASMHSARGFLEYVISRLRKTRTMVQADRTEPDRVVFRFSVTS